MQKILGMLFVKVPGLGTLVYIEPTETKTIVQVNVSQSWCRLEPERALEVLDNAVAAYVAAEEE